MPTCATGAYSIRASAFGESWLDCAEQTRRLFVGVATTTADTRSGSILPARTERNVEAGRLARSAAPDHGDDFGAVLALSPRAAAIARVRAVSAAAKIAQRWPRARAGLAAHGFQRAANDAAVLRLQAPQRRKRAGQAEPFGIAGVHAGNERRDEIGENVVAELAPHEGGDGFVALPAGACAETAPRAGAAWCASRRAEVVEQ